MLNDINLNKSKEIKKIGEFDFAHLEFPTRMVIFKELYGEGFKWITEFENEEIELIDYYCKNEECPCTQVLFIVEKKGEEIGEFWHDYKLGETKDFSDPKFKSIFQEFSLEEEEILNASLAARHEVVKKEFTIFKLKNKLKSMEEGRKAKKTGRNEPCPCGSGLKYKKCCL